MPVMTNEKQVTGLLGGKRLLYIAIALIALTGGLLSQSLVNPPSSSGFTTSDGQTHTWDELQGRWVIINYFAPWCAPCLREVPQLNAFYRQNDERVQLFAINYDPATRQEVAALKQLHNMQFPVIVATPDTRLPVSAPPALPATYVINPQGQVSQRLLGEVTVERLNQALNSAGLQPL